jgi:hypothetical protein
MILKSVGGVYALSVKSGVEHSWQLKVQRAVNQVFVNAMKEKINRQHDKRVYQPKLHVTRVHDLHELKEQTGTPMTVHLDRAVREYVENYETGQVEWIEDQTWEEHAEEIQTLNQIDYERNTGCDQEAPRNG